MIVSDEGAEKYRCVNEKFAANEGQQLQSVFIVPVFWIHILFWHHRCGSQDAGVKKKATYSLVIPVLKLENHPYLDDLLQALAEQDFPPKEVHLVIGDCRQGRAINYGVSKSRSEWVGTLDDDSFIEDRTLFSKLTQALVDQESYGLVGAACAIPEWATPLQKRAMKEIPRRSFPVQARDVESDMVQHPCLLMSKALFDSIGGEDEELVRGLDPVLRKKVRDAGRKVVIVADTTVAHLLPSSFRKLCRMYFRNGRGSAYAQKYFPERVLELSDGFDRGVFVEFRPLWYRCLRRSFKLLSGLVCGRWLLFSTDVCYGCGVIWERIKGASPQAIPKVNSVSHECVVRGGYELHFHRVQLMKMER